METDRYQVILTGDTVAGADPSGVRTRLAALFRIPEEKAEALLGGRPVVVKKGLDAATAERYRARLEQAGAVAQVAAQPPEESAAPGDASGQEEGTDRAGPGPEAGAGLTLAPPGSDLSDPEPAPPLQVDLSGLTLAEPGARIGEPREVPPLQVDTGELEMEEPPGPPASAPGEERD
ncbi:hypothetical protein [Ectothiorhodospira mobilis]|uniref:hypothetical protein n=1 Tax=Ectothiorhodospira mobilis TaxID=195064 RepID=UPI001EE85723|nr:hypothetical protein [Ectothiorhodospira mobilis]MCG5536010.1 hypothetical protein [Ectothiorhodospira mobilis]